MNLKIADYANYVLSTGSSVLFASAIKLEVHEVEFSLFSAFWLISMDFDGSGPKCANQEEPC